MKNLSLCCAAVLAFALPGRAANFTVTTTNDSGAGSLRQAIIDANTAVGADVIAFNISPPGPTIIPASALPPITEPVALDGTTQPGYLNAPIVELSGQSAGSGADGLKIFTSNCVIRALMINRFLGDGIEIATNGNNVVEGCVIGLDAAGVDRGNSANGININRSANNRIGGMTAAARNVISGNSGHGVNIVELTSFGNVVLGNFIGTDAAGTLDRGNSGDGVEIDDAPNNVVGGTTAGERNIISGNNGEGVEIFTAGATNNLVLGNFIGTDVSGTQPLLNGSHGVYLTTSARWNVIGGTNPGAANLMAFNGGDGVFIATGTNNAVRANRVFANVGLGIDLGANGVTANDATDTDTGANQLQNFPVLTNATGDASSVTIQGSLTSRPSTAYQIDFFANQLCDPTGSGEGQFYLGSASVTTDGAGVAAVNVTLATALSGRFIAASATDPLGNTSELSPCVRASSSIAPAAFTVVNTNNSGAGSLRQAILDSNARVSSSANLIQFNIPGDGVQTIAPASALPAISEAVVIDGYSQPGATANTHADAFNANLLIRLDGVSAGTGADGLALAASNSTVRGLVIVRFNGDGIHITSSGNTVAGNVIGLDVNGTDLGNGDNGVFIESSGANTIGGATPASRNVISGNSLQGVWIANLTAAGNIVAGNLIGTDQTGTLDRGNSDGVQIDDAPNNVIGGTTPAARNIISGNSDGIQIFTAGATNNLVQGNFIGTDVTGTLALPNSGHGVHLVTNPRWNVVGGTNSGDANLIAFNGADGVFVSAGTNNAVRANRIHSNGGLGLDIGANNITANDVGDADTGANQLQNFPLLTNAVASVGSTLIQGTLNSRASTAYALDFFSSAACDPSANGEGQVYLGSGGVTTDASGNVVINVTLPVTIAGGFITATATDPFGNTSEFSPCTFVNSTIPPAAFTVVNTNDAGAGSLRQAMLDSNARVSSNNNVITFNVPGGGVQTITPLTELPAIGTPVTIDGFTQPGASANTLSNGNNAVLRVRLNGTNAGAASSGLVLVGSNSIVRGLIIVRFGDYGIELTSARRTRIEGNFIGIDADSSDAGNALAGIFMNNSADNVIGGLTPAARNVVSGNNAEGILIANPPSSNNVVQGNFIGTDLTGTLDRGNSGDGVQIDDAPGNLVGGTVPGARNLISGNSQGVEIFTLGATNNVVQGNLIGTDITGTLPIANSSYGVYITTSARGNVIGGTNAGAGNVIWFNSDDGVFIASGTNNTIRANSISLNGTTSGELGIDLGTSGITTNDVGDVDGGANQLQNWPVVTNAVANAADTFVQGTFNSRASETYQLDFFANVECDTQGNGEGALWLGAGMVTTDASGNAAFTFTLPRRVAGRRITATATDSFGNTSEFSPCHSASSTIPPQTFTVVNTNNSGAGSLRQALLDNNAAPSTGQNTITFNIPGSGVRTIAPPTVLPAIIESVLLDGYSQPGASPNSSTGADNAVRLVRIDFALAPSPYQGLVLQGNGSTVRGLVIVNSLASGVDVLGNNNVVSGNAISVDTDGVVRPNNRGVEVVGTGNRVGGTLPAERNLIDGAFYGVLLPGPTNYVQGNFIGTDATGTIGFSNATAGIDLGGDGNVIGGSASGAGNLIAPGDVAAILHDAAGTIIQGNFIGVDITGTASLNPTVPADGILVRSSFGLTIGGASPGAGNLISGINRNGILFQQGANNGHVIQGNRIGTDASGTLPLGNRFGLQFGAIQLGTASSNLITGNIIAFNRGEGVIVASIGSTNNSILGNSIFDNNDPNNFGTQERGIRLGGSPLNDPGDGDTGQNQLQNYPELAYATVSGGQTTVRSRLNSQPGRVYRVEFFSNPTCDQSGFGEGKTFLGATNVTTGTSGNVVWNSTFGVALAASEVVTATATDPEGNTSEFSACAPVVSPSAVDVRVALSVTPTLAALSQTVTNTITLSNIGPATATGLVLTHQLPPGATFVSAIPSQGSASHSGGVVTANLGSLAQDAVAQVIVRLMLNTVATNRSTATVAAAQSDFLPTNNIAVATNWSGIFDLAASISSSPQPITAGQTLTLNVAITNLGPDLAAGAQASITVFVPATNDIFATENHRALSVTVSGGTHFSFPIPGFPPQISWFLPTLAPGAVATAQITLVPTLPGNYTNRVSVAGPSLPAGLNHDPNGTNNFASAPTTVNAGPGILDLEFSNSAHEDDGSAVITVRRVGGAIGTVSAQYSTLPGTATAGSDYTAVSGTVTFTNGQVTQTFPVPLINDGTPECNEFLSLRLSNPAGGAVLVGATNAVLDIYDDDQPPPLPSELPMLVFGPSFGFFENSPHLLSADGCVAVFVTDESDLVPNDTNDETDIFARDLVSGTTTAVSRRLAGTGTGNDDSADAAMTPDGRFVAFQSYANNLVPNDPMTDPARVLRHDRLTGQTELVHANTNGSVSTFIPGIVDISANGRFIAFESSDAQITPGDTNTLTDVFVRDLLLDETTLASAGPSGQSGNAASTLVSLSPTAGHLLFFSSSTNLVAGVPTNIVTHYVRDLVNGTTDTLLRNSQGTRLFGTAQAPTFSRDGRTIVFATVPPLVPNDTNVFTDVYVRDLVTGTARLVSQNSAGNSGNSQSSNPAISDNGRYVAFMSFASDLVAGDTNGFSDIFRRDLWTGTTELVSRNCPGTAPGNSPSDRPAISADGRFVAFFSRAIDLVAADFSGDAAFSRQVYVRDMLLGQTRLVTFNYDGTAASSSGFFNENELLISADGGTILFTSDAEDLVENDETDEADLYAVRLPTVSPSADLSLTMTGAPNPVGVGSNVTYTLIVTNHGPATATNVVLIHSLPAANFVSANMTQGSFTRTNNTIVANIGSLPPGARATLTVVVNANAAGTLLSVASVTAYQPDLNPANNFGSVTTSAGGSGGGPQPTIAFGLSGNQLVLTWPDVSTGYTLFQTPTLNTPIPWAPATNAVTQSGGQFRVTINPSQGAQFFRLSR